MPEPLPPITGETGRETATLAGGCFWCTEAVFFQVRGVESVESGFTGGSTEDPTYREVYTGTTGHAETVRVVFDPGVISYREILEIFFGTHDPTTPNRQGEDVGTHYRSAIFYHSDAQRQTAKQTIADLTAAKIWDQPIVTQLAPAGRFYRAEEYHQDYFARNPGQSYCAAVVGPKVAAFRKKFAHKLKF